MILLGIVSASVLVYGLYLIYQNEEEEDIKQIMIEHHPLENSTEKEKPNSTEKENLPNPTEKQNPLNPTENPSNPTENPSNPTENPSNPTENPSNPTKRVSYPTGQIDPIHQVPDLWSSCHLDEKYDEMKERKGLRDYLNLGEWKAKVQKKFSHIMNSSDYQKSPIKYIQHARDKRAPDEYAVVEDTALNLLEYYEVMSSQDGNKMFEMKELDKK